MDFLNNHELIEDNSIDLIIVDPPYGINYKEWDYIDFNDFTNKWVDICVRKLKDNGTMWSFMGYQNVIDFIPLLRNYGNVNLENWVIWARQKGRGSSKHLKSMREDIIHFTKGKTHTWNNLKVLREVVVPYVKDGKPRGWFLDENGKRVRWTGLGNVWTYTSPFWKSKSDPSIHPAQKPVLMIERLLLLSSNNGDLILDPFSGSGVVTRVCKFNNRNSIAFEIDEEMYNKSLNLVNEDYNVK